MCTRYNSCLINMMIAVHLHHATNARPELAAARERAEAEVNIVARLHRLSAATAQHRWTLSLTQCGHAQCTITCRNDAPRRCQSSHHMRCCCCRQRRRHRHQHCLELQRQCPPVSVTLAAAGRCPGPVMTEPVRTALLLLLRHLWWPHLPKCAACSTAVQQSNVHICMCMS